ncbi:MAG: DUF4135 domain-containing protein, partial [Ktedonobacteraceae bacterium]
MQETSVNTSSGPQEAWYRALTVAERIALPQTALSRELPSDDAAYQRLQHWKEQTFFREGNLFAARLAENSLTEANLLTLLGETDEALRQRTSPTPPWLTRLAHILARADFSQDVPQDARFAHCVWPLIADGVKRLRERIDLLTQAYTSLPIEPEAFIPACTLNLVKQINTLVSRTMVLELNIARLQGLLHGETTQERFLDFLQLMQKKEYFGPILEEYTVMARLVITTIDLWINYMSEFLSHLHQDWQQICEMYSPESEPGVLIEAQTGAGDTHRGGRSVIILKFSSGLKLVYKPRSIAIDVHFQELLGWLNARVDHPPFRVLKLLGRENYGWSEFVEAQS